jgi:hypothetical protein
MGRLVCVFDSSDLDFYGMLLGWIQPFAIVRIPVDKHAAGTQLPIQNPEECAVTADHSTHQ